MNRSDHPFIDISCHRSLKEYDGDVMVWDIDKTYLQTHFSSVRGLFAIPFEFAIDKQAVLGAVPLLRALRRGGGEKGNALVPLFFVSGSPPQLRRVIEKKMTLDGVDFDGISFKDQWGLVKARRPKGIKEQVGYKLCALLLYRRHLSASARYFMFGDDVESDAEVFTLFGEVCAGLSGRALEQTLEQHRVHATDIDVANRLVDELGLAKHESAENPVERVFIHLERKSDPSKFKSDKVVATHSFLQSALVLAGLGRIRPEAIASIADEIRRLPTSEDKIGALLLDAKSRLGVSDELLAWARK